MGIAVPSQLWKASQQQNMALIGYSGLGLAGYGLAGLGGWAAPLAIHRDGPFLCGNGEHLINGLCKKKRSAEAEPEAWYGWRGYSGAPIAGGALVIGQNSVTPDYTPEQKGAAWGLNWGLVKRDADSEADAYYGYGGAYTGYGYGGLGYGYGGLGYGMAVMARDLPTLRRTLTMATVAPTPDTATAVWAMAMAVSATDMAAMARDLLTLRLILTTAMVAFTPDMATAVWATAMVVSATDTASVPRTPMPTTAMAVTVDTDLDTPLAMVMVDTATLDKSAKGWCRELQPMKRCSISKLGIRNKPCFLEIGYFLMCIFMDKKTKYDKK